MILLTQQVHPLLTFSSTYKSNSPLHPHVQLKVGVGVVTPFSQVPIMPFCKGRPYRRKRKGSRCSSSAAAQAPLPPDPDKENREDSDGVVVAQGESPDLQTLFRRFWKVAAPYWTSDDKGPARLQLAGVFALTLATTGISVGFNFLGRDFFNSLANKDQEQFTKQLLYYLGAFAGGIPVSTLLHFLRFLC